MSDKKTAWVMTKAEGANIYEGVAFEEDAYNEMLAQGYKLLGKWRMSLIEGGLYLPPAIIYQRL